MSIPVGRLAFELDGGLEAGVAARRAVLAGHDRLPAAVREDVLLLITELVGNSVRHAGAGADGSVKVELRHWPERVRVEVVDSGHRSAQIGPSSSPDDLGGWGLVLVDRISARWGVGRGPAFTRVWFEIEF